MSAKMAWLRSLAFCLAVILIVGLLIFDPSARAQGLNATLSGTVTDQSGAAVADAELTLINKATGLEARSMSNERGEYTFRNLTPGTYDLKVTKGGFESYIQKNILITINAAAHADVALKVGSQSESVTVEGGNTLINYDNGTIQGGVDPETLKGMPLVVEGKLRSAASLAVLLPGVSTGSSNQPFRARINGGQESSDEALLDGASMQQGFMSQSGMVSIHQDFQMSPDMVQEVKVIASDYDAQYGGSTSGQIAVVTKSGGNTYHGAAFEYHRNRALNAKPYNWSCKPTEPNCDPRPKDIENDLGANIGGPVKLPWLYRGNSKHKSFFYFNWEYYRLLGGSKSDALSLPSMQERSGNFSDWLDSTGTLIPIYAPGDFAPGSNPSQAAGPQSVACRSALPPGFGRGQQFPSNRIPQACISPIASAYLAELPTPTNAGTIRNYLPPPVPDSLTGASNYYMFRIDHSYGYSDHFYFTFWRQYTGYITASQLPRAVATESPTRPQNSPIMRLNWEHIFSPKMTNHVTFGYLNRNEGYGSLNLDSVGTLPQIRGAAGTNALPQFNFDDDGFNQISNSTGPPGTNITVRPTWVLNDLATRIVGHHTFTFGAEWRNVQGNIHASGNQSGSYRFQRSTTGQPGTKYGSPVAGFLLGAVSGGSVDRRTVSAWFPRQKVYVIHGNDSWKITPKLTLNIGLRWDLHTPSREKFNHYSFIDPMGANPDAGGRPGRLAFAGSGYGAASYGAEFPEETWKKGFAPRLGLAYSWDQKTVVRAGYGLFFARAFYPGWGGGMALDGFNLKQTFGTSQNGTVPAFYLDNGVPTPAQLPPFISSGYDNGRTPTAANNNGSAYRPVDANRRGYSQQWNLTIEHQLPQNMFMSVAYVGSKGTRLTSTLNPINVLNPFDPSIRALETPIDPNCGIRSPNPANPVACKAKLNDVFQPGQLSLQGVAAPYAGWAAQLAANKACDPTVAQALLPFPQFCGPLLGLNENHGNSIYHSFQLKAEKRYSKGVFMLASYTFSKLIADASDNTQQAGGTGNGSQGVFSPFEKTRARTISSDDVPHVLSLAVVYDFPLGKGKRYLNSGAFVNGLVGGWQLSPIFHYSTGTPMWFRSTTTCQVVPQFRQSCLAGIRGTNAFLQSPNGYDPGKGPLLNIAAFEPASNFTWVDPTLPPGTPGAFGYTGSGTRISNLRGPNFKEMDFSVTKNTRIGERMNFQIRVAFFNAFNTHYFIDNGVNNQGSAFAFNNDINGQNFGAWKRSISPPRTIQIGGRLEF